MNTTPLSPNPPLRSEGFLALPLGSVRPLGWLLRQCRIQADGITGQIEEIWPDLGPNTMWLGGATEGWERGPYYLDGLIPLAYILDDAALKAKAQKWVDSILTMQDATGWLGPVQAPNRKPYDQWPVAIVLKALTQHYEATEDARILPVLTNFCRYLQNTLAERPLFDWGHFRWADLALSVHWLYNRTGEKWLLGVALEIEKQGYNWRRHFEKFRYTTKTRREDCTLETHVVNNAMAVKAGGVAWRQSGDEQDKMSVYRTLEMLDEYHGQATGIFTGDEHYAGKSPSQGTELCAVVEYLFSLEELLTIFAEPEFGDRLERIAYNALPAAFTDDMWGHQYDQQANQVLCTIDERAWTNNDPDSNTFGLEPNFGCCTANLHQGWPKLVKSLWMGTLDGGLAAVAYGPCKVTATLAGNNVTIREVTDYPFRETIEFLISCPTPTAFPLILRIPAWAKRAAVKVNEELLESPQAGDFHTIRRTWQDGDTVTLTLPMDIRLERRYNDAVAVHRGPLVYGLYIGTRFEKIKGDPPAEDWAVHPTTPWNYALLLNPLKPDESFQMREEPVGEIPFAADTAPVTLQVPARCVPDWNLYQFSAAPPPQSPVTTSEPVETIALIPYGSAKLRITEFPVAGR